MRVSTKMAIVLPIAVDGRLVGSAALIDSVGGYLYLATSLHLFGQGTDIRIAIPPHGGNCTAVQTYPITQTPAIPNVGIEAADPLADLAIIVGKANTDAPIPAMPTIVRSPGLLPVGSDVVVLGYPFAPIGSFLETWTPAFVTALARRQLAPGITVEELVLSAVGHPGSSGSAVVGKKDGIVYGILRGALGPPEILKIGDVPIATDTAVTFATSAHLLHDLLVRAKANIEVKNV